MQEQRTRRRLRGGRSTPTGIMPASRRMPSRTESASSLHMQQQQQQRMSPQKVILLCERHSASQPPSNAKRNTEQISSSKHHAGAHTPNEQRHRNSADINTMLRKSWQPTQDGEKTAATPNHAKCTTQSGRKWASARQSHQGAGTHRAEPKMSPWPEVATNGERASKRIADCSSEPTARNTTTSSGKG